MTTMSSDPFMKAAIEDARQGLAEGGIPIGSVLVQDGKIIGRGHNRRIQKGSAILHGEMDALENAGRLPATVYRECTIYTTLSPCSMCSGAILLYGIPKVVIGENQTFMGEELIWAYGQYDCYSSLQIYIPSKDLQLFITANNNLMSDPARLIYGDATSSLFVLSFLKNFVFPEEDFPILISKDAIKYEQENDSPLRRETLLAQALAESFLARFNTDRMQSSSQILDYVFATYPAYTSYADLSVLHNLIFLKDIAAYMEMEPFTLYDLQIGQIAEVMLQKDPLNPYLNVYLGNFYDKKGDIEQARMHYQRIVEAPNFSHFWYTNEANAWLGSH